MLYRAEGGMSEPALVCDRDLDFSRYAPVKRQEIVWCQSDKAPPGELAILARHMRGACGLIRQCVVIAAVIIWRRITWRIADFYHYVLGSLPAAWTLAGIGWGGFIAFPIILHFAR
jgi:hypothetical protein